jgi:nicotinamidase-related amidase
LALTWALLRANGIDTLVLGCPTSGVVLSTIRHAGDLIIGWCRPRCCADRDAKVHAMLLDIVIAKQAAVVTTAELAAALTGGSS